LQFLEGPGQVGARSLNIELRAALNPAGDRKVERFGWTFAPGDKVMQIENDYDKEGAAAHKIATRCPITIDRPRRASLHSSRSATSLDSDRTLLPKARRDPALRLSWSSPATRP
jgi:hypothetical protein